MTKRLSVRVAATIVGCCSLWLTHVTDAQTNGQIADVPVITVAHSPLGSNVGFSVDTTLGGPDGSISQATTGDGFTFVAFDDVPFGAKQGGGYHNTQFELRGFAADPGQAWLVSVTVNGKTLTGATASNYTYVNGQVIWSWTSGPVFNNTTGPVTATIVHGGNGGWLRPHYQVVGLTYAPPGSRSTAVYSNGFMDGTTTSNSASVTSGVTEKVTIESGFNLFGIFSGNTTATTSASWTQEQDSSNSVSIMHQESTGLNVPGPASSSVGVDHDFDQIYIWLNPEEFMEAFQQTLAVGGYGYDARDTITGMDVLPLTVGQLRGTQPISDPATLTRLARTWDPTLGGLTSADFQAILRADPFAANPSFNPNTDTSGRYELPQGVDLIFNYEPLPPGAQPTGQTYTSSYSSTSTLGKTAKDTYSVSYSYDGTLAAAIIVAVNAKLSTTATLTYANSAAQSTSSGTTQSANFTIFPPVATDNYTGPTAVQVWKDNIYGTFMFYPEN